MQFALLTGLSSEIRNIAAPATSNKQNGSGGGTATGGGAATQNSIPTARAINRAKKEGNIALLREIAADTPAFILRQGWTKLFFAE